MTGIKIDNTILPQTEESDVKPMSFLMKMAMNEFLILLLSTFRTQEEVVGYIAQHKINLSSPTVEFPLSTKMLASMNASEEGLSDVLDQNNISSDEKEKILANFRFFSKAPKPSETTANTTTNSLS
ncbi:hypothetical protein [Legionella shakespearei]|uniref:Uncharacterized protein n=1 Tax=Legionella shakespearei DSM 23087 TaxID=1122169 RepID=A0A0W0YT59_9GAMM|nr:hypothetical protein [Legionella shakespearei]KTD60026.1 hypothetical protein Lsha_1776 [Legionella shakespearei DSM 23087]